MTSGASDFPKFYSSFNASYANGNPLGATALRNSRNSTESIDNQANL